MQERSDEELMDAYARGKVAAFESLYDRHRGPLYRYLLRLTRSAPVANELYQETWERIIRSRKRFRPGASFRPWMYRIAHNLAIDHLRRARHNVEADADTLPSASPGPEEALLEEQQSLRLAAAVSALPEEQREALLLRLEGDLDLQAIADATGVSRETAKSRLRYAVNKLRSTVNA